MGNAQFSVALGKLYQIPDADAYYHTDPGNNDYEECFEKTVAGKIGYLYVYATTSAGEIIVTLKITTPAGGVETENVQLNSAQGKWVYRDENGLTNGTTQKPHGTHESIEYESCKVEARAAPPYANGTAIMVKFSTSDLN